MGTLLGTAFLAGLVGTPHCAGMCGPFAVASRSPAWWSAGRVAVYMLLGGIAGGVGSGLTRLLGWPAIVLGGLMLIWFAARLAGLGGKLELPWLTRLSGRFLGEATRQKGVVGAVLFGVVSGLLPCGLTWAALSMAVSAGQVQGGMLAMLAFGLGTLPGPVFGGVILARVIGARPWVRPMVAVLVLVLGGVSLVSRAPVSGGEPACHHHE